MPATLTFDQYLLHLQRAVLELGRSASRAGLDVPVPTCPDWTVRRLVGHLGAVHRWLAGTVHGEDVDLTALAKAGRSSDDPVGWLRDGVIALVRTLVEAPEDLEAPVFLRDAPAPRLFLARRACHETVVHAVDVLAAALGRLPRAEETWIDRDLALDGVDELVLGFAPRSRAALRSATPLTLVVHATDAEVSYAVRVTAEPAVAVRHDGLVDGDVIVAGSVVPLYLSLWHRSDDVPAAAAEPWASMVV